MNPSPLDDRGLPPHARFNPEIEIAPRQLKQRLDAGEPIVLLDCRTPPERDVAKLPDTHFLPLQEVHSRLDELQDMADDGRPIVVYCHHGMRSLQMAAALRRLGAEDVRSLAGGIDLWSLAVDPDIPRY